MKRKNDVFAQLIVGGFMIALIVMLGYFTIAVSGVELFGGRHRRPVRIAFEHVGGLKDHDNVMYRGTKVGTVERVEVTGTNLVVNALVDDGIVLRTGYRVVVCNTSMLGGTFMQLEEGEGETIDPFTTMLAGEPPTDWMQDVACIAKNLRELTSSPEIKSMITNFAAAGVKARAVCDKIEAMVAKVERGEGTVGKLLSSDETIYNDLKAAADDVKATVADAKATAADARAAVADVKTSVPDIKATFSNAKTTFEDAKATFANAKEISARLNREQTFADLEAGVAAFRKATESFDLKETVAKANALLDNLNAVSTDLRTGKGTLGKLAQDPKLYDEIDGLIRDVRQVIDNYRDTTPISTFSSLATGAL